MNKTAQRENGHKIAVDIETLSAMLSCGNTTARQIGKEAMAEIRINRRVLYNVKKVQSYIDSISF